MILTGLKPDEEYYIALTAYNTEGVESGFSNDVCVQVIDNVAEPCVASISPVGSESSSGGGGGSDSTCFITTASHKSSIIAEFITKPTIRSQVLALVFLLLVLIAVKLVINRIKEK